jgi:hypothetical protein
MASLAGARSPWMSTPLIYNSETTDTAWHILRDFIVPLTVGKTVATAQEAGTLMNRIRGHEMARAGLENALWRSASFGLLQPARTLEDFSYSKHPSRSMDVELNTTKSDSVSESMRPAK